MAKFLKRFVLASGALALMSDLASAHTGAGGVHGFASGFLHPANGLDHVLAMVAVGLFAVQRGGKALWLVPLAFVTMMAVGGALGVYGVNLPAVELGIAASVILLGAAVALQIKLSVLAAMGLAGFFALFHGHAHGGEMPLAASGLAYAAGFMVASGLLHGVGIAFGAAAKSLVDGPMAHTVRLAGGAMAVAGLGILSGIL